MRKDKKLEKGEEKLQEPSSVRKNDEDSLLMNQKQCLFVSSEYPHKQVQSDGSKTLAKYQ